MGAGALAAGCRPTPTVASARPTVKIRVYGAYLLTKAADGSIDVLMPRATAAQTIQHPDTSPARPHDAFLGIHSKHEMNAHKNSYRVPDRDLTFVGERGIVPSSFTGLASLEAVLPESDVTMRPYEGVHSKVYASRMKFVDGTFTTKVDERIFWRFAPTLNLGAPQDVHLANYVEWDSLKEELEVVTEGGTTGIPKPLKGNRHPAIVIAHLPQDMPPADIYDPDQKIAVNAVDHDFKWLFRAFYPKDGEHLDDPWSSVIGDRVLPAPQVTKIDVSASGGGDPVGILTVGSPNCFGGCFGC